MTAAGWIIMIAAVGGISGLLSWAVHKVVSNPKSSEHLHAQTDIDPHDRDEP
jgi:hypothetical protein